MSLGHIKLPNLLDTFNNNNEYSSLIGQNICTLINLKISGSVDGVLTRFNKNLAKNGRESLFTLYLAIVPSIG